MIQMSSDINAVSACTFLKEATQFGLFVKYLAQECPLCIKTKDLDHLQKYPEMVIH